jgi:hypothetical protein
MSDGIWPESHWTKARNALAEIDWAEFRSNKNRGKCIPGIEGSKELGRGFWRDAAKKAGLSAEDCRDSLIGGPEPPQVFETDGVKVTTHSIRQAYHIQQLKKHLPTDKKKLHVLELGPGYGAFAEMLCRSYDVEKYYLLDGSPVFQTLQGYYMTKAGHGDKISFDAPWPRSIDLIVTFQTLGEMPLPVVGYYVGVFEKVLKPAGLLQTVQMKKVYKGSNVYLTNWDEYPWDDQWTFEYEDYPRPRQLMAFGRRNVQAT